jgi:hypothetical protein
LINEGKLNAKDVALTASFTALYAVFGFLKIFPVIGQFGQAITAAAIMAPVMGILLDPYISILSTLLGGIVWFFLGSFFLPSLVSGTIAALCAGTIHKAKRIICICIYLSLLLLLAFYPSLGVASLYPLLMWFQIVGFIVLVSPLQSMATKNLDSKNSSQAFYGFFITCLTSTLAGQIAGSLTYTILVADANSLRGIWTVVTIAYPAERTIIALGAAFIGTSLQRVLRRVNIMPLSQAKR